MSVTLAEYGYKTKWSDIQVDGYEGYQPQMTDYHMHEYYEISLILSGRVNVLLPELVDGGEHLRLVLMRPMTPHYVTFDPEWLYKRKNVVFSAEFLSDFLPQIQKIMAIFGKNGSVLHLDQQKAEQILAVMEQIEQENSRFRQKILLILLLSLAQDAVPDQTDGSMTPPYITQALTYISAHYDERIVAEDLAQMFGVGRTTLMTSFKKYVGITMNEYLTRCRIKNALKMLEQGKTEQATAEECGFTDACNLIRAFKRVFGQTPRQYLSHL